LILTVAVVCGGANKELENASALSKLLLWTSIAYITGMAFPDDN
jgi:hypothetical protein